MRREYFQVVGRGPLNVDHPNGNAVAYRPGQIFEESPLNRSVARGVRISRLRKLSPREATAIKAMHAAKRAGAVTPKPGLPKSAAKSVSKPTPKPVTPSSGAAPSE
jgi:hypothetical protein